jgi:hypothetical protein
MRKYHLRRFDYVQWILIHALAGRIYLNSVEGVRRKRGRFTVTWIEIGKKDMLIRKAKRVLF